MFIRFVHIDPIDLSMRRYNALLERISDLLEAEGGRVDHRSQVDRMLRRARDE